jgi:TonB family protein
MSRRWLIAVSAAAHLAVGASVFLSGAWRIEQLDGEHRPFHLGVMLPPPAASGGPVAPEKPEIPIKHPPKVIVKVPTQPDTRRPQDSTKVLEASDRTGPGNGSGDPQSTEKCLENCGEIAPPVGPVCGNNSREDGEQCDDGNTTNGDGCSSTCRIEAPPQPKQVMVATKTLQALRLSGDTQPRPSTGTQQMMIRDNTSQVSGQVTLCVGTDGSVASVVTRSSTKYPEYDQAILAAVRTWRYEPYKVNGTPTPVCSVVNFVYTMR